MTRSSVCAHLRLLLLLPLALLALALPQLGSVVADLFNLSAVDPDGAFAWISIHHIVQGLLGLLVVLTISKLHANLDYGLKTVHWWGFASYTKKFLLWFLLYTAISWIIGISLGLHTAFPYPASAANTIGYLGFQALLSGPAEEIIFRSLLIGSALALVRNESTRAFWPINVYASLVFTLAHIGISWSPLRLSCNPMQLAYAFVLGLVYGHSFIQSRSVLLPMLLHSLSNVIAVSVQLAITEFLLQ
jgi:uncharacterized protein